MSQQHTIEQLVAYTLGELPADAERAMADRLERSTTLRALAEDVREAVAALEADQSRNPPPDVVQRVVSAFHARRNEPAESWIDKARRIVAQLVFDSRREPAVSGFRGGGGDAAHLLYESRLGNVDIRLTPTSLDTHSDWRIQGQISEAPVPHPVDVTLLDAVNAQQVANTQTNERGYFAVQAGAGHYDVLIQLPDETLALEDLRVG